MAPEQARGERADASSDLFSLGCVLYQLCTGKLPFPGATVMAVLTSLSVDTPSPPGDKNPTVPPALDALILGLLAKDPADRPASAEVVVQVIKSIERGLLAERDRRILPIAFHVDYFNDLWTDVFSDPLYSKRQMVYNQLYTGPKHAEYGLYYTPMLMIDGQQSVNGRDRAAAEAAIRQALARRSGVRLDVALPIARDGLSGTATIKVVSRSPSSEKTPLLLCAVLREDGVVTNVLSGENKGKSLVARFPARRTKYEYIELDGRSASTQRLSFEIETTWNQKNLRLAVFVQDKRTGIVHQAADVPWRSAKSVAAPATPTIELAPASR
jgi:hypothetical protein